jgi:hypothetical protein
MNEDRNQDRVPKQQAKQKHPDEWQQDLNPNHLAGQNIGAQSDVLSSGADRTAFHLRKNGMDLRGTDDELKLVPVIATGERLQQGATYIDLNEGSPREFTARGDMSADEGHAYAPKDRVPYQVWNRLIGEAKPGQERPSEEERPPR